MVTGPKTKVKIKIAVVILTSLSEWYDKQIKTIIVLPGDNESTEPVTVEFVESNPEEGQQVLTSEQIRAIKAVVAKFGTEEGTGTVTVTLAEVTELQALFDSNIIQIDFEAATSTVNEETPINWCEDECEDGEEMEALEGLAVFAS